MYDYYLLFILQWFEDRGLSLQKLHGSYRHVVQQVVQILLCDCFFGCPVSWAAPESPPRLKVAPTFQHVLGFRFLKHSLFYKQIKNSVVNTSVFLTVF